MGAQFSRHDDYARFPTAFSIRYVLFKRRTNLLDQIRGR
jgi:hypothetical protein